MPIKINGTNTAANPSITGSDTDTGIVYGSDQIDFSTGGTSKAAIDASGNLTLGGFSAPTDLNTAQVPTLFIDRIDNNIFGENNALYITQNAYFNNSGSYERVATHRPLQYKQRLGKHKFLVGDSGSAGGNVTFSEAVIIDADGLKFNGDTSSANALDDYEEGTWTATVNYGNHITTNAAYYTKIGQMVFWHLHFRPTFAPNDTAVYQIYGLPFTSKNVTENYGWTGNIVYTANANNSNIANMRPLVQKNDTYIYFHTVGLGNSVRVLNNLIRSALVGHDTLMGGFYMAA